MSCTENQPNRIVHNVDGDTIPIKQFYCYPPHKKNIVQEEVDYVLQNEVIELLVFLTALCRGGCL